MINRKIFCKWAQNYFIQYFSHFYITHQWTGLQYRSLLPTRLHYGSIARTALCYVDTVEINNCPLPTHLFTYESCVRAYTRSYLGDTWETANRRKLSQVDSLQNSGRRSSILRCRTWSMEQSSETNYKLWNFRHAQKASQNFPFPPGSELASH